MIQMSWRLKKEVKTIFLPILISNLLLVGLLALLSNPFAAAMKWLVGFIGGLL